MNSEGCPSGQQRDTRSVRLYRGEDVAFLAAMVRDAILVTGKTAYPPEQLAAWARFTDDIDTFGAQLEKGDTWVITQDDHPVALAQLYPFDHVALLYTHCEYARTGLASMLYGILEAKAIATGATLLTTHASRISKPLFERFGFRPVTTEYPMRHGVQIERYRMQKSLEPTTGRIHPSVRAAE